MTQTQSAWGKNEARKDQPCAQCGKHPRHQYSGGGWDTRCIECLRLAWAEREKKAPRAARRAVAPIEYRPVTQADWDALEPEPAKPEKKEAIPADVRDGVYGVLADMLMLADRGRHEVQRGAVDALRMTLDVKGVRVGLGVERTEDHRDGE